MLCKLVQGKGQEWHWQQSGDPATMAARYRVQHGGTLTWIPRRSEWWWTDGRVCRVWKA